MEIGRWHSVDPHAENYFHASPFSYVENNPISRIDPDGRDWYSFDGRYQWRRSQDETYTDDDGNEWKNAGANITFTFDGYSVVFQQHTNESGELSLSSYKYNHSDVSDDGSGISSRDFVLGMQSSGRSREAAQNYLDNPTYGNFLKYALTEVGSQWISPEKLLAGAMVFAAGLPAVKGGPKPTPNFNPPTNAPQLPPSNVPAGMTVRIMRPTQQYPNGYWRLEKPMPQGGAQGINPQTMKPGPQHETHVQLPPGYWN